MNEQPVIGSDYDHCRGSDYDLCRGSDYDLCRGSAWAELDEAFFQLVQDSFSHTFCAGSSVLLASNDELVPERPAVIVLPDSDALELDASIRRHPSSRRRF